MESQILTRSSALNNIPPKKVKDKLSNIILGCEECVKRDLKYKSAYDGLCAKCATINTLYNRYSEANIPMEYWDLKMEKDFQGFAGLKVKYEEITQDLKQSYVSGTSVCFAGSHGLGKTMTTTCILKKACQKGYNCLYTTLSDIVNVLTGAGGEDKFLARRELLMVDFLVIDEFDSRFMASDNAADLYARTLESVFRTRSQNKLPTFMCTNSPNIVETFHGPLKQSIDSLMKGYMKVFVVMGEDFRKRGT